MATKSKKKSKGLRPKTFHEGLNPKRFKRRTNKNQGARLNLKKGSTLPIVFGDEPTDGNAFVEGERHVWQESGRWIFVPCAGDGCPLCESDDDRISGTSYVFYTNVYSLEDKAWKVLEGGNNLATIIHQKHNAKPARFTKCVWDISMYPTQPVSFGLERSEEDMPKSSRLDRSEPVDLDEYMINAMKDFYGDDLSDIDLSGLTSLDDDDDDDDYEDEDEDEEDDDEDDDEDEEDERPKKKSKKSSSKSKSTKKKAKR